MSNMPIVPVKGVFKVLGKYPGCFSRINPALKMNLYPRFDHLVNFSYELPLTCIRGIYSIAMCHFNTLS